MKRILKQIVNDTLKSKGKWSKTNLSMFICFIIAGVMASIDFGFNGLRLDVFIIYISAALGWKYYDHIRKDNDKEN